MRYYAIGDLHFSGTPPKKPMSIFGSHWLDHEKKIIADWHAKVTEEDVVFLVGDISWAMRLTEAMSDLNRITALPGHIIMIRGNHDYWWSSKTKMTKITDNKITFLQGDFISFPDIAAGGTRGYLCPNDTGFNPDTDQSIYERELMRTEAALAQMNDAKPKIRILLLHYPPFNDKNEPSGFTDLLEYYKIDHCIFGHLHDTASFDRIPSYWKETQLHLVSADYLNFSLKEILPKL